jgi:hypothetical protein
MAGMCWHADFLRSAWATLEVVLRYVRRQKIEGLPYPTMEPWLRHCFYRYCYPVNLKWYSEGLSAG